MLYRLHEKYWNSCKKSPRPQGFSGCNANACSGEKCWVIPDTYNVVNFGYWSHSAYGKHHDYGVKRDNYHICVQYSAKTSGACFSSGATQKIDGVVTYTKKGTEEFIGKMGKKCADRCLREMESNNAHIKSDL